MLMSKGKEEVEKETVERILHFDPTNTDKSHRSQIPPCVIQFFKFVVAKNIDLKVEFNDYVEKKLISQLKFNEWLEKVGYKPSSIEDLFQILRFFRH